MNILFFKHSDDKLLEERRCNKPIQLFLKQTLIQPSHQSRNKTHNPKICFETIGESKTANLYQINTLTFRKQTGVNKQDAQPIALPKIIKLYYKNKNEIQKPQSLFNTKIVNIKKKRTQHLQSFTNTLLYSNKPYMIKIPSFSNAITQTGD